MLPTRKCLHVRAEDQTDCTTSAAVNSALDNWMSLSLIQQRRLHTRSRLCFAVVAVLIVILARNDLEHNLDDLLWSAVPLAIVRTLTAYSNDDKGSVLQNTTFIHVKLTKYKCSGENDNSDDDNSDTKAVRNNR